MEEKRKLPVRTVRVDLDGDYQGWWFDAKDDFSAKEYYAELGVVASIRDAKATPSEVYESIYRVVKRGLLTRNGRPVGEWNFVDEEGEPVPLTLEAVDSLPTNLLWATFNAYLARLRGLPPA